MGWIKKSEWIFFLLLTSENDLGNADNTKSTENKKKKRNAVFLVCEIHHHDSFYFTSKEPSSAIFLDNRWISILRFDLLPLLELGWQTGVEWRDSLNFQAYLEQMSCML